MTHSNNGSGLNAMFVCVLLGFVAWYGLFWLSWSLAVGLCKLFQY